MTEDRAAQQRTPAERKIRIFQQVRGDFPFGQDTFVDPGIFVPLVNPHGAVAVVANDGTLLGIKPGEFEWIGEGVCPKCGYEAGVAASTEAPSTPDDEYCGQAIAARAYQIFGALDAPVRVLDYFWAVAQGEKPAEILPFTPDVAASSSTMCAICDRPKNLHEADGWCRRSR